MTDKNPEKKYNEFFEERAKKLYEYLLLQFLRSNYNEIDASEKARSVIRKQCNLQGVNAARTLEQTSRDTARAAGHDTSSARIYVEREEQQQQRRF